MLSLITPYRNREEHLNLMLPHLARIREVEGFDDFELILVEGNAQPTVADRAEKFEWVRYLHVPLPGVFNRGLLANRGAACARGRYLIFHDVDMLPAEGVLAHHVGLASVSPHCLVAGYRIQLPEMPDAPVQLPSVNELVERSSSFKKSLVCEEDTYGSLLKYLLCGERWGASSCYAVEVFRRVGSFDEEFVGWGPEDQDLIERVCDSGKTLVRAYDLLYFHLPHKRDEQWFDPALIEANRNRFDERRRASQARGN